MNNKITSKIALDYVIDHCEIPADILEKLCTMRESLNRKTERKSLTPTQKENAQYREIILNTLTDEGMTVSEIIKAVPELTELSTQRISPIVGGLVKDGLAVRETKGKKAIYRKA